MELDRSAYVTLISIAAYPQRPDVPVIFVPWYSAKMGEEGFFSAGRHLITPCRRPPWYYTRNIPGAVVPVRSPMHYMAVVTQSAVDQYELADDLYHATLEDDRLQQLLRAFNAPAAAPFLERAPLDRSGPIVLAGLYVAVELN